MLRRRRGLGGRLGSWEMGEMVVAGMGWSLERYGSCCQMNLREY